MIDWKSLEDFLSTKQAEMKPDFFIDKYANALIAMALEKQFQLISYPATAKPITVNFSDLQDD